MPPDFAGAVNRLHHLGRAWLEGHFRPQFPAGDCPHTLGGGFLESNNASRDVSAGAVELVIAPSQQRAVLVILAEQINVDYRREAASQQEQIFRQVPPGFGAPGADFD
ncbi:MAG: hypothetical protein WAO35_04775 [Terriglobia bacterium]